MESGSDKWNPFYKYVFCLHMTLCMLDNESKENYYTWKKVKEPYDDPDELSEQILKQLNDFPIANMEMIPFKTHRWSISENKVIKLFEDVSYHKYVDIMKDFIEKYSDENTYIILAGGMKAKLHLMKKMFGIDQDILDESYYQIFSCGKAKSKLSPSDELECSGAAPVYFIKWKLSSADDSMRKFVILPGISPSNTRYRWLYDDVEKLVKEIKNYFDPK